MRGFLSKTVKQVLPDRRWGRGQRLMSGISEAKSRDRSARGELRPHRRAQAKDAARGASEHTRRVCDRVSRARTLAWALLCAALILASTLTPVVSVAAEVGRPEYVAQLEKICKPGSESTQRAVRGMRSDIRAERFKIAASKFAKAKRIFAGTVSSISTVPRPVPDRSTLSRWFAALGRETDYLGRTAAALRAEDIPRFQRVSGRFFQEGSKANNVVVSFGFNYCNFKFSRYE
jgi:hypothetical protein